MNWDAIGAVGENIGAFAVVVSLIYLAMQIRAQNLQAKLSALHEMSRVHRETTVNFATRDISDIFVRANQDYAAISDSESVQLIVLVTNFFRAWEAAFLENRDGNLDENVWSTLAKDYSEPMGASSFRHIWSLRKQNYDPDFQKLVDEINKSEYIGR